MAEENNELKLVVRGLPFEATEEEVLNHFRIQQEQLSLPTWSDSGRCKGIAFVTCDSVSQKTSILQMDDTPFTASDNTRDLSIKEYEDRPRKTGARRGGGSRRGNKGTRGGSAGRGRGDGASQSYVSDDETAREIYISNAAFSSTKESFTQFFSDIKNGEVESITIPTQYQSGKPKGFAFVRFTTVEARDQALTKNGEELDGRALGIRENKGRAERAPRPDYGGRREQRASELSDKPQQCTTIFVGNLPWATDEDELKGLFEDCGEVVNARIVRQSWTQRSRGFGYVEFAQEASVDTAVQKQITVDNRELRLDYAENLQA
jgi:nucleolin